MQKLCKIAARLLLTMQNKALGFFALKVLVMADLIQSEQQGFEMKSFEMVIVKPTPMPLKVRQQVEARRRECKCIACGQAEQVKRELCTKCYGRFDMNRPPKSQPVKRAKYEAAMQANGMVGENRQGQRVDLDAYREIIRKLEAS